MVVRAGGCGTTLGCAGMLAAGPLMVGFLVALVATGGQLLLSLGLGAEVAAIVFLAAALLFTVDGWKARVRRARVRRRLAARGEESAEFFDSAFALKDVELAREVRRGLAAFFVAPVEQIHAREPLDTFAFQQLMPGVYFAVIWPVCARRGVASLGRFPRGEPRTVADLVTAARLHLADADPEAV